MTNLLSRGGVMGLEDVVSRGIWTPKSGGEARPTARQGDKWT